MGDQGRRGRDALTASPAPARGRHRFGVVAPGLVLGAVLLLAGAYLVRLDSRLWFFGDEWDFLLRRGTVPYEDRGLWMPHNEHWSTLPILLWRALYAIWGLSTYTPYVVPVIVAHLLAVAFVAVACRRAGTSPWACVAVGTVLAVLGAGAENLTWAFQIGFVGSVCLGWAAVVAVSLAEPRRGRGRAGWCAVAALLVLGSLMCSGVGITMAVLVALYALARLGLRTAVLTMAGPGAAFLVWYALLGRHAGHAAPPPTHADLLQVPLFIWTGIGTAGDRVLGLPGDSPTPGGLVLVAVLVGVLLLLRRRPHEAQLALAGIVAALVQLALSGVSRVSLGVEQAAVSRYVYLTCFLVLPAVAVVAGALLDLVSRRRAGAVAGLLVLVLGTGYLGWLGVSGLRGYYENIRPRSDQQRALLVAAVELARSGAPLLEPRQPDPRYDPDISLRSLLYPGVLATFPTTPLTAQGRLDASSTLQVAVVTGDPLRGPSRWATLAGGPGTPVEGRPECTQYVVARGAYLAVLAQGGGSGAAAGQALQVTTSASVVQTQLVSPQKLFSSPSNHRVRPGTPVWVESVSASGDLLVRVNQPGGVLVCGSRGTATAG